MIARLLSLLHLLHQYDLTGKKRKEGGGREEENKSPKKQKETPKVISPSVAYSARPLARRASGLTSLPPSRGSGAFTLKYGSQHGFTFLDS
jgi:hypothetical protein